MVTSLKGLNVGGATHERRLRVGRGGKKKKKSLVEVEPKPSAAVPCHIFAEHDSRTIRCGNDLGFSLSKYKQGGAVCFTRTWISESRVWPVVSGHGGRPVRVGYGADRSPPTAGANGTTNRNPKDKLQPDGIFSHVVAFIALIISRCCRHGLWRFVSSFLGFYSGCFLFMVWILP